MPQASNLGSRARFRFADLRYLSGMSPEAEHRIEIENHPAASNPGLTFVVIWPIVSHEGTLTMLTFTHKQRHLSKQPLPSRSGGRACLLIPDRAGASGSASGTTSAKCASTPTVQPRSRRRPWVL